MRRFLLLGLVGFLMVAGMPGLSAPASARKQCTTEDFFSQTVEYTPEAFTAGFAFDMRCLPKGTELTLQIEGVREDILVTEQGRDGGTCKSGQRGPCKFKVSFDHAPIERADYHLAMTLTLRTSYFASSARGHESWTCTSAVATAFCE
jgi:hypothetical protein